MYQQENERIASSELTSELFGNLQKYREILMIEQKRLKSLYPDSILDTMMEAIDSRVINLCPMVMCDALLNDLNSKCPDDLLAGIGLSAFSISTHDDVVDELPTKRDDVAGLVYSGNISTLEGLKLLVEKGYSSVIPALIECLNKNHYYQTKIVQTLWTSPTNEEGYLSSIRHTGYWVAIGLNVALMYSGREDLRDEINEFAMNYGLYCQIVDDMREIADDRKNGYWSLPIVIARNERLNLDVADDLNKSISRPRELAKQYGERAKTITKNRYPRLYDLVSRIEAVSDRIRY